jgi:hypothetical protein
MLALRAAIVQQQGRTVYTRRMHPPNGVPISFQKIQKIQESHAVMPAPRQIQDRLCSA